MERDVVTVGKAARLVLDRCVFMALGNRAEAAEQEAGGESEQQPRCDTCKAEGGDHIRTNDCGGVQ